MLQSVLIAVQNMATAQKRRKASLGGAAQKNGGRS
jgi:hypothetical protein